MSRHFCLGGLFEEIIVGEDGGDRVGFARFGGMNEGGTKVWGIEEDSREDGIEQIHVERSWIGRDSWNNRRD